MIELGKVQKLKVLRWTTVGVFVGIGDEDEMGGILLPNKYVKEGTQKGDEVEVFVYRDSEDRLIATNIIPPVKVGEIGFLKVLETGNLGAFLDWGLEKDLLLPHREQQDRPQKGRSVLVALYIDKTDRICATTYIEKYLEAQSPYKTDDRVNGLVYRISDSLGVLVAVDNRYMGLIPKQEAIGSFHKGDTLSCRVASVKEDGKLILSLKEKAHIQMDTDTVTLLQALNKRNGFLDLHDDSDPELIRSTVKMSKRAFKRAVGRLLKEKQITMTEKGITLIQKEASESED